VDVLSGCGSGRWTGCIAFKAAENQTESDVSSFSLPLAAFLKTKVLHPARTRTQPCDHAVSTLSREHRMHSE